MYESLCRKAIRNSRLYTISEAIPQSRVTAVLRCDNSAIIAWKNSERGCPVFPAYQMVLHNSKWDKKAKRAYNKKHGIAVLSEKAAKTVNDTQFENPITELDTAADTIDIPQLSYDWEQDEEERDLIWSKFGKQYGTVSERKNNIHVVQDVQIFEEIRDNIRDQKLRYKVKENFGRLNVAQDRVVGEETNIDDFMEQISTISPLIIQDDKNATKSDAILEVDPKKQQFLDSMIQ